MGAKGPDHSPREARRDRTVQDARHDTYQLKGKLHEPTICPSCSAVFHKGRWTWGKPPAEAHEQTCPACRRIQDRFPAGEVSASGPFFLEHKNEIVHLIHNEETQEKSEHPLSRIMSIREGANGVVVSTTDTHLARRIGNALHHAYQGDCTVTYGEDQQFVRVQWVR